MIGAAATAPKLDQVLAAGVPLRKSPSFVELLDKVDVEASLWTVMNGNSKVFDQAQAIGMRPRAVFGAMVLSTGLSARIHIRLDSAQAAQNLAGTAQGQLGMVQGMFDTLDVAAVNADVVVSAVMNEQQLANVAGLLAGSLGP